MFVKRTGERFVASVYILSQDKHKHIHVVVFLSLSLSCLSVCYLCLSLCVSVCLTSDLKKSESTNILTIEVREHLINNYQNHIKIFTDGSYLEVIPELKVQKSLYLGKGFSIFTFE